MKAVTRKIKAVMTNKIETEKEDDEENYVGDEKRQIKLNCDMNDD